MIGALFVAVVVIFFGSGIVPLAVLSPLQWRLVLTLCVLVPLLEELVFRGLIQGYFRQYPQAKKTFVGISAANLLTSLLFVLMHWLTRDGYTAVLVFLPSIYLGVARDRIGSLLICIFIHAFWNLTWYLTPWLAQVL
jgi:uncharacterized protein